MYESGKLQEAEYFLGQMRSSVQDPEVFRFNLKHSCPQPDPLLSTL